MIFIRSLIAITSAGLVAACSVSSPLALQSTGDGITRAGKVALVAEADDSGTARRRFGSAIGEAFTAGSIPLSPDGEFIADYALAVSDASDGVVRGGVDSAAAAPDWLASPRRSGQFDKCQAQRMRGTLILFDRASGAMIYRGSASRIECDFSDEDVADMASALVRDALKSVPAL